MSDVTRREFLRYGLGGIAAAVAAWMLSACGKRAVPKATSQMPPPGPGPEKGPKPPEKAPAETKAEAEKPQTAKDPEHMTELEQKHVPQFELPEALKKGEKATVTVNIGKVPHPMIASHYIMWAELYVDGEPAGPRFELKPEDKPQAKFEITPTGAHTLKAHIFCDIHGLWENTHEITAT